MASNPNTPKKILEALAKNSIFREYPIDSSERIQQIELAKAIVNNPALSNELKGFAKKYLDLQKVLIKSPKEIELNKKARAKMLTTQWDEKDFELIMSEQDSDISYGPGELHYYIEVAKNPYISKELLDKVSRIKSTDILYGLLHNNQLVLKV